VTVLGLVLALVLYLVAQRFKVEEDPRIDEVEKAMPGANCGGCGFAGCRAMAEAMVNSLDLSIAYCPGGDYDKIGEILGIKAEARDPQVCVVRCNGTCENAPSKVFYDSALTCAFANSLFAGESSCPFGCLGCGDCVKACAFDAIHINPETHLPEVNENLCVGCKACAKACPRGVLEIRDKGRNNRRVFVACNNKEKGAVARKNCTAACIGCGKCAKVCPFEAITVTDNLAYIDYTKCKACRKCVAECPTGAIHAVNFPEKKEPVAVAEPAAEA
jgi:Na+-translocating ferredoxin:NAD+ oxidoreductase RNF subunit RnfB